MMGTDLSTMKGDIKDMQPIGRPRDNIISAVWGISSVAIIIFLFLRAPLNVGFALAMLYFVWWLDASVKKMLKYENMTMFADLSFSALIFLGTQGISISLAKIAVPALSNVFINMVIICACVLILWLVNLQLCSSLYDPRSGYWLKLITLISSSLLGFLCLIIAAFYEPIIHLTGN